MLWIKPNGTEIELNGEKATIEKAVELDWKPKEAKAVKNGKGRTSSKGSTAKNTRTGK